MIDTDRLALRAHDNYLIAALVNAPDTYAGLIVPESVKRQKGWATILDVGGGVERLEVGHKIIFKDSAAFVGGVMVTQVSGLVLDEATGTIAVHKGQVLAHTATDSWELKAYDNHVVAQLVRGPDTSASGLHLPESMRYPDGLWATVVDVGHGIEGLFPGDRIRIKESASYQGGAVITKEKPVFLDEKQGLLSVYNPQIVARIPAAHVYGEHEAAPS